VVVRGWAMTVRPGVPVLTWVKMSPAVPSYRSTDRAGWKAVMSAVAGAWVVAHYS